MITQAETTARILVISPLSGPEDLGQYARTFFGKQPVDIKYIGGWNDVVAGGIAVISCSGLVAQRFTEFLRDEFSRVLTVENFVIEALEVSDKELL